MKVTVVLHHCVRQRFHIFSMVSTAEGMLSSLVINQVSFQCVTVMRSFASTLNSSK